MLSMVPPGVCCGAVALHTIDVLWVAVATNSVNLSIQYKHREKAPPLLHISQILPDVFNGVVPVQQEKKKWLQKLRWIRLVIFMIEEYSILPQNRIQSVTKTIKLLAAKNIQLTSHYCHLVTEPCWFRHFS